MIPELTASNLQMPRTQAELRAWVDQLHHQFGCTEEGKRAVRLNKGNLVKQFMEEVWPLSLFADAFYESRRDVLFKFVLGYESYDALIIEASGDRILHHLQITQSFDGYRNHLRMLHLEEHGHAPATGPDLEKDKSTGRVQESWPEAVPHDKLLLQTFERIRAAAQGKSLMRYEKDTSLIVEFEDAHLHSADDRAALDQFANSTLVPAAARFAALYLVSDRERLAFEYKIVAPG